MSLRSFVRAVYGSECRGCLALTALAATVYFSFVLFPSATERSGSADNRIVQLQRAYAREDFISVLERWSESRPDAVKLVKRHNVIELDLVFPVVYAIAFGLSYAWLRGYRDPKPMDLVFFLAPFLAAAFDYVENGLHLTLLTGIDTLADVQAAKNAGLSSTLIFTASAFAHAKYLLLGIWLVGIVVAAFQRVRR